MSSKLPAIALVSGTLLVLAFLFARHATQLIADRYLPLEPTATAFASRAAPQGQVADPSTILGSALFASTSTSAEIPAPETTTRCDGVRLVAAITNPRAPRWSLAAIVGPKGKTLLYRAGQNIGDREVIAVHSRSVELRSGDTRCEVSMFASPISNPPAPEPTSSILRINDHHFVVSRALVNETLANPSALASVRAIPHQEQGRTVGVKLYGLRRQHRELGLRNGDVLREVNGNSLTGDPIEVYMRVRNADRLSFAITRRGREENLVYEIRELR